LPKQGHSIGYLSKITTDSHRKKDNDRICKSHLNKIYKEQKKKGSIIQKVKVVQRNGKDIMLYDECEIKKEDTQLELKTQSTSRDSQQETDDIKVPQYWYECLPEIEVGSTSAEFKNNKISNAQLVDLSTYFGELLDITLDKVHFGSGTLDKVKQMVRASKGRKKKNVFVDYVLEEGHFSLIIEQSATITWYNTASRCHSKVRKYIMGHESHSIVFCRQKDGTSCGFFCLHFALQKLLFKNHEVDRNFIYKGMRDLCLRALSQLK